LALAGWCQPAAASQARRGPSARRSGGAEGWYNHGFACRWLEAAGRMLLDLTRIQGPRAHVERAYGFDQFDARGDDFRVVEPIGLVFDVEKKADVFRLVGRVTTALELGCSRCLEPFRLPVNSAFDLRYLPQATNRGGEEDEVGEDALDVAFYEGEAIDLGQMLREQFYLVLPMKPLCRLDCRGICPVCGANRNTVECGCEAKWEDPRLAPLKGLRGHPDDREP